MKKLMVAVAVAAVAGACRAEARRFVDYVESNGSQYIDLGIPAKSGLRITTRMSWTATGDSTYIGAQKNRSTKIGPVVLKTSQWALGYGGNTVFLSDVSPTAGQVYDLISVLSNGTQTLTVDGGIVLSQNEQTAYVTDINLYLFAQNHYTGLYQYSKARCYSLKIETNSVDGAWILARDLHPIASAAGGALYDFVTGETLHPNTGSLKTSPGANISHTPIDDKGTMRVYVAVEAIDENIPCTLTATVRDCDAGVVTSHELGTVDDSKVRAYEIPGLSSAKRYEVTIHGYRKFGSDEFSDDLGVFSVSPADAAIGDIYLTSPIGTIDGNPYDWSVKSTDVHRLPQDGDRVLIGIDPGNYSLTMTNSGARYFNGWCGASDTSITGKTLICSGTTLNITNAMQFGVANRVGCEGSMTLDGGTLNIHGNFEVSFNGTSSLRVKGGTLLRDGTISAQKSFTMGGSSRVYLEGGAVTVKGTSTDTSRGAFYFYGPAAVIQSGGTVSLGSIPVESQDDSFYEISGGSLDVEKGIRVGKVSKNATACTTIRLRGSGFEFSTSDVGNASVPRKLMPSFYDFRIRSDAKPGKKGVGFIDYHTGTTVYGAWRAVPDGGVAIVHTNLFPLIVQRAGNALELKYDFEDNAASHDLMQTGLFKIAVPAEAPHMIRADLNPSAELASGWANEVGVAAGFVRLPRISNPDNLGAANLKLKVKMLGEKDLASLKADIEGAGLGPVKVDGAAADYNLVVGLPKSCLARGSSTSKVLVDFTTVTGALAAQTGTVTTNALIQAVAVDIRKPGLVLMVH